MLKDNRYLSCLIWAEFFFYFLDSLEINTIKAEIQHCAYEKKVWGLIYLEQFISNMKNYIQEQCRKYTYFTI